MEAKRLFSEGKIEEGMSVMDALTRESARAATRNLLPSSIAGHLTDEARARYQGRTFVDVCQDLVKGVMSSDAGGTRVLDKWTDEAVKAGLDPVRAIDLAKKVVAHYRHRATEDRELLAWALVELEVRHAEALKVDPAEFARPIRVTAPEAEAVEAEEPAPDSVEPEAAGE